MVTADVAPAALIKSLRFIPSTSASGHKNLCRIPPYTGGLDAWRDHFAPSNAGQPSTRRTNLRSPRSVIQRCRLRSCGIVAFPRKDLELVTVLLRRQIDRAVLAVGFERRWLVRNEIPAADHLLQIGKTPLEEPDRTRHE